MPLDREPPVPLDYARRTPDWLYRSPSVTGGRIGALIGGVLIPVGFGVICALVFEDMGGPCFWPIAVVLLGGIGWMFGTCVGGVIEWKRSRRRNDGA